MHGGKDRRMEIPTMLIFISEAKAKETRHRPHMHKQVLFPEISGLPAYDRSSVVQAPRRLCYSVFSQSEFLKKTRKSWCRGLLNQNDFFHLYFKLFIQSHLPIASGKYKMNTHLLRILRNHLFSWI